MSIEDIETVGEIIAKPIKVDHPAVHEDGVWFGLDENEYHAAFALSASGIKNLRISTLDFWARSVLNPDYEDEDTEAMKIGRAYDRRITEGKERFYQQYAAALATEDLEGALKTVEDITEELTERGIAFKKSAKKPELVELLKQHAPEIPFHADLIERHEAANKGKELLSADLIHRIEVAAAMIEKHPQLGKAFTGGYAQVSIFWHDRETGVPMKARMDYLKPRAIVDLKTFENMMQMPVNRAIARAVANQKYHIQAALYLQGAREARSLIRQGRIFGEADKAFLGALEGAEEQTFLFVFQQKGIAPLARGKVLAECLTLDLGRHEIAQAKAVFARCWQTYGTDPWLDIAEVETFDSTEFPAFIAD